MATKPGKDMPATVELKDIPAKTHMEAASSHAAHTEPRHAIPDPISVYRTARGIHRLHSYAARIAAGFDPSLGDLADDMNATDSDSDRDSDHSDREDSIHSRQTDDESIHANDSRNADDRDHDGPAAYGSDNQGRDSQVGGGSVSAHHALSGSSARLPTTRSSKPSELTMGRDVVAASSTPQATKNQTSGLAKAASAQPTEPGAVTSKSTSEPGADTSKSTSKPVETGSTNPAAVDSPTAAQTPAALVQTQIVKVRKADGTIIKVRRPIKPGATATTAAAKTTAKNSSNSPSSRQEDTSETTPLTPQAQKSEIEPASSVHAAQVQSPKVAQSSAKTIKSGVEVHETEKFDHGTREDLNSKHTPTGRLVRRASTLTQVIIWTIMIVFPIFFIVLGILSAVVNGRSTYDTFGAGVKEANSIAVSLWPIIFAALAAQALRMFASYKAESGIRLMTLEQLMNSHSLASAIKQPFLLRRLNWISIALFCLWSLSPITGQALLRMCYIGADGSSENITVQYLDTTIAPDALIYSHYNLYASPIIQAVYGSSMLAPLSEQQDHMDAWGNPKIPSLEDLTSADENGWYEVGGSTVYSSLVGVPIANSSELVGGNMSFTIQSSYFHFDCPQLVLDTLESLNSILSASNTAIYPGFDGQSTLQMGIKVSPLGDRGNIIFASQDPSTFPPNASFFTTNCTFKQSFVQSQVFCTSSLSDSNPQCRVEKMRPVPSPHSTSPLIYQGSSGLPFSGYYDSWIDAIVDYGRITQENAFHSLEYYISDPFGAGANNINTSPNYTGISALEFTQRLGILLNTYWQAAVDPFDITGSFGTPNNAQNPNTTTAFISTNPVYRASWGWLSLVLFSSVVLLLGSVAGAICDARTVGPDIFGFASSLARNNKYMKVPDGGSAMSGPERARMLGNVKVMLQDVKGGAEVGKIALGTVDGGGQKLKPGRLYK